MTLLTYDNGPSLRARNAVAALLEDARRENDAGGPAERWYPGSMTVKAAQDAPGAAEPGERFRPWRRLASLAWMIARTLLPCPDLIRRHRVRSAARKLVECSPWPGLDATGTDAAQLAILRVLWLQRQTRRAVRGRHREASVMLARSSVETCILGLYCLHEDGAVAHLQAANIKAMRDVVHYLNDTGLVPAEVIERCVAALGEPRPGPKVWDMAKRVEQATGHRGAISLYQRFYVPTSNFFVHANAGSLLRHVGTGDKLTRRPSRAWTRRSPARVADACTGILASAVAERTGRPATGFASYADKHLDRALTPLAVLAGAGLGRSMKLRQPGQMRGQLKIFMRIGGYIRSGQATSDPIDVRAARIREALTELLPAAELDIPPAASEPYLDYLAATLAESAGPGNS